MMMRREEINRVQIVCTLWQETYASGYRQFQASGCQLTAPGYGFGASGPQLDLGSQPVNNPVPRV